MNWVDVVGIIFCGVVIIATGVGAYVLGKYWHGDFF